MANFTYADIEKHDFGYIKLLLEKIKNNEKIKINGKLETLDFNNPAIQEIQKLINQNKSPLAYIKENFKLFTKIDKAPFSGSGGSRKPASTDESEQGVIIWLDIIEQFKLGSYDKVFLSYLITYKAKQAVFKSTNDIKNTIKWLQENDEWNFSCFSSAFVISKNFKLQNYEFHQNTNEFNSIRAQASKLGKITPDKWNPADIYLIHKSFKTSALNKFKTIYEMNEYIGAHDKVIGVSLKKSQAGANQGKAAINNVSSVKSHIPKAKTQSGFVKNKFLTPLAIEQITKYTQDIFKIVNTSELRIITKKADGENVLSQLFSATVSSGNYEKSLPVILSWLSEHKDTQDIISSIQFLTCLALSRNPVACAHWKSYGSDNKLVEVKGTPEISVECLRIKLNGDIDVIFDLTADNNKYKGQIRSFGSLPQLELKKQDSLSGWVNAKIK